MQDFKKLEVWQKAHELTLGIYKVSLQFPKDELYGLTSKIKRAVASVPTNIAEGCGRGGNAELARFLQIAMGSASEVEYQLLLARDLGFLQDSSYQEFEQDVNRIKRMLTGLIKKLKTEN